MNSIGDDCQTNFKKHNSINLYGFNSSTTQIVFQVQSNNIIMKTVVPALHVGTNFLA